MTNAEKYKTAGERFKAQTAWCKANRNKGLCDNVCIPCLECTFRWLDLEAEEEKLEDCPFCGAKAMQNLGHIKRDTILYWVDCTNHACMYRSGNHTDRALSIAEHNRVCKAVKAYKESEAK